ncbi:MAG: hypothetical protein ACJ72Z_10225 [Pyrinomonadaceae bacterium]
MTDVPVSLGLFWCVRNYKVRAIAITFKLRSPIRTIFVDSMTESLHVTKDVNGGTSGLAFGNVG